MSKRFFALKYFGFLLATCALAQIPDPSFPEHPLIEKNIQEGQNKPPVESEGLYFTDASQARLYSGEYREYFDSGAIRLEMHIKNGKPEGAYVVYYENGKPNEIRSYLDGKFHGIWRTYNENGNLIAQAEYQNDKKHGKWFIWDDNGIMRYEMYYFKGKKAGIWYMWDEKGKLISEKKWD